MGRKRLALRSRPVRWVLTLAGLAIVLGCTPAWLRAQDGSSNAIRRTTIYRDIEREYFVRLPRDFAADETYWLLVTAHGGGGTGGPRNWLARDVHRAVNERGFDAIVVSPTFTTHRFPSLGEGAFFEQVLDEIQEAYRLRPKLLLAGYSRGSGFSHRFAFGNPNVVEAVSLISEGTWTTPDGRLLNDTFGEVADPRSFLRSPQNAEGLPENRRSLFTNQIADVAGLRAKPGAENIPFLVMCGTLDPRCNVTQEFAENLENEGYRVETEWTRTAHNWSVAAQTEFYEYSQGAVEFFLRVTEDAR